MKAQEAWTTSPEFKALLRRTVISRPQQQETPTVAPASGESKSDAAFEEEQKSKLRRAAQQLGVSYEKLERDAELAKHWGQFPEDMPGGANDRARQREQSRRASGWYDSVTGK